MIELIEYVGNASKILHRTLRREFFSIFAATFSYMPMQNKFFLNLEINKSASVCWTKPPKHRGEPWRTHLVNPSKPNGFGLGQLSLA